eukprot:CAMPEP_0172213782 /NCGR_PEP_ID=MMETSP1050-20130122/37787_1 /TAXON_ID=233186 /ORGANISM="Cryptomonas curvata, Strain CCAP979/52" /LENGTH=186 /DNA_ID=CAMNT_0012894659 /DNA_START=130 /DNA_END=686 /DNA_ORIENTATION=-
MQKIRAARLLKHVNLGYLSVNFDCWLQGLISKEQLTKAVDKAKRDKNLELQGLQLREFPEFISRLGRSELKDVKRMAISDNRLRHLQSDFFTRFKSLMYLFLSNNHLTLLPSSIGVLSSLQILSVDNNRILGLHPAIGELNSLHTFHVQQNPSLDVFPIEFGKLRHALSKGSLKEVLYDIDSVRYP